MEEKSMNTRIVPSTTYTSKIGSAATAIKLGDYDRARVLLGQAAQEDQNQPEYHNLLGIIAELKRDLALACRHYRAAYALDPSYEPASRNLARITSYSCARNTGAPDYGDACKIEELPASFAYAEYKSRNQRKRI
jgi:tetratricopeptide (TPR) repeat protein